MKKAFTAILALLILGAMIVSCGGGNTPADTTKDTPATTTDNGSTTTPPGDVVTTTIVTDVGTTERTFDIELAKPAVPYEFKILNYDSCLGNGWSGIPNDISVAGEQGEYLNDAVYKRNNKLYDLTGITVVGITPDSNKITNALKNDINGQEFVYDAVNQQMAAVNALYNGGYLMDMNDSGIDFNYNWWDQNCIDALTVGTRLIAVCSDITYMDKLSTVAVFFNKSYAGKLTQDDFYKIADGSDWTFDKMMEYCALATEDVGGDEVYNELDKYGISCQNDGSYYFLNSAGITTVERNEDGDPVFKLNELVGIEALTKIYKMMSDRKVYFNRQSYPEFIDKTTGMTKVTTMFAEDRVLFLIRPIQTLYDLRSATENFGIIPMPKFYENQEQYYSPVNFYGAAAICLPTGHTYERTEQSGYVLQALGMLSDEYVMPKLYDTVLGSKLIHDQTASSMLDIIFENRIYDLGLIWKLGGDVGVRSVIIAGEASYADYPSGIKQKLDTIEKIMDSAIDTLVSSTSK